MWCLDVSHICNTYVVRYMTENVEIWFHNNAQQEYICFSVYRYGIKLLTGLDTLTHGSNELVPKLYLIYVGSYTTVMQ